MKHLVCGVQSCIKTSFLHGFCDFFEFPNGLQLGAQSSYLLRSACTLVHMGHMFAPQGICIYTGACMPCFHFKLSDAHAGLDNYVIARSLSPESLKQTERKRKLQVAVLSQQFQKLL